MIKWVTPVLFPNYEVSNTGLVRRKSDNKNIKISSWVTVQLIDSNGKQKTVNVSRLVLTCFVGPCPEGMQACHFPDRTRTNNDINNLRWDTPKSNSGDRIKHGTQVKGRDCHSAKLYEKDVLKIREVYARGGITRKILARKYQVNEHLIYLITKGLIWKHLPMPNISTNFRCRRGRGWKKQFSLV